MAHDGTIYIMRCGPRSSQLFHHALANIHNRSGIISLRRPTLVDESSAWFSSGLSDCSSLLSNAVSVCKQHWVVLRQYNMGTTFMKSATYIAREIGGGSASGTCLFEGHRPPESKFVSRRGNSPKNRRLPAASFGWQCRSSEPFPRLKYPEVP